MKIIEIRGKKVILVNPSEKASKYVSELKSKQKLTYTGEVKRDKNGKKIKLNKTSAAYRIGYLQARTDNAKAYKSNNKNRIDSIDNLDRYI